MICFLGIMLRVESSYKISKYIKAFYGITTENHLKYAIICSVFISPQRSANELESTTLIAVLAPMMTFEVFLMLVTCFCIFFCVSSLSNATYGGT